MIVTVTMAIAVLHLEVEQLDVLRDARRETPVRKALRVPVADTVLLEVDHVVRQLAVEPEGLGNNHGRMW